VLANLRQIAYTGIDKYFSQDYHSAIFINKIIMLTIRLSRTGKKKQPQYRVVLQESHRDPWSPAKEVLGHYDPRALKDQIVLNIDRIKELLAHGAQPSNTVYNMLITAGVIKADKKSTVTISNKRKEKIEQTKADAEKKLADEKAAKEKAEADKTPEQQVQ
jgi:small subunit ribosomal protein S16